MLNEVEEFLTRWSSTLARLPVETEELVKVLLNAKADAELIRRENAQLRAVLADAGIEIEMVRCGVVWRKK